MSVPHIKALTKRIRLRIGSSELAAKAAGLSSKGKWSLYESEEHPGTTLPIHRFMAVANAAERRELIDMLTAEDDAQVADLMDEAAEAVEATCNVLNLVRLANRDKRVTEAEARPIRAAVLQAKAQLDDVMQGVG